MINVSDSYLTIAGESSGSYRERASKFIAIAYPVSHESEIRNRLEYLRKKYHDANHFCYAYRIGHEHPVYRVNDDGEPPGSAGKPIYSQILSNNLTDLLIVVIRYFGGKKLGIPGLINAYRTSAKDALAQAQIVTRHLWEDLFIQFPYPLMNEVMHILKDEDAKIKILPAEDRCNIHFSVFKSRTEEVKSRLNILNGLIINTMP